MGSWLLVCDVLKDSTKADSFVLEYFAGSANLSSGSRIMVWILLSKT